MTNTKEREEIQRWEAGGWDGELRKAKKPPEEGDLVDYFDHLRHLKLAQIAVLEELCRHAIPMKHSDTYPVDAAPKALLLNKIAALRKELE